MNSSQLINQTSGNEEYYTPENIIEAARRVLGDFDLDPASSEEANRTVKAERFFTKENDGLKQRWEGRVWMNHPFGIKEDVCVAETCKKIKCVKRGFHCSVAKPGNAAWINKLIWEVRQGTVSEALCITYACTSEAWLRPLLLEPQCFLSPRTNYRGPDGKIVKGVTKGSVVTYFGLRPQLFARLFEPFGVVKSKM